MAGAETPIFGDQESGTANTGGLPYQSHDGERQTWAQFADARTDDSFCRSWLAIQCRQFDRVSGALMILGPPDKGPYSPVAVWPDVRRNMEHLAPAAERALIERRGLLLNFPSTDNDASSPHSIHVAYPIEVGKKIYGVVVLDVAIRPEAQLQAILRQLYWGSGWLETLFHRQQIQDSTERRSSLISVLDLVATSIEHDKFKGAAIALATELAMHYSCHRVSIGLLKKDHMSVEAISHSAQFENKANLIRVVGYAMDESFDQRSTLLYPAPDSNVIPLVTRSHEQLARSQDTAAICTVPLLVSGSMKGAITLERRLKKQFVESEVSVCETVAAMVAPILWSKKQNDRLLLAKISDSLKLQLYKMVGRQHTAFKLVTGSIAALLVFSLFANGNYRVGTETVIEGSTQRVISVPFNSYLSQESARAGDEIAEGDVLAILDDKELRLENQRVTGQKNQLQRQYREAMAEHNRAGVRITMAQLSQVNAKLDLLAYQISRAQLTAPFDGVIVKGDLSQQLGAPLEKGDALFTVAPLNSYRVILQVDERDINDVEIGQTGVLALSSMPSEKFGFSVEKITAVSVSEEGRNYFRVEAVLDKPSGRLRPGMEGVGKISIDRRKIIWIWTHRMTDWLRLWVWSWWP